MSPTRVTAVATVSVYGRRLRNLGREKEGAMSRSNAKALLPQRKDELVAITSSDCLGSLSEESHGCSVPALLGEAEVKDPRCPSKEEKPD
jgi:hypothetical protein